MWRSDVIVTFEEKSPYLTSSPNFSTVLAYNISNNPEGNNTTTTFFLLFNLEISTTSFCVLSSIGHRTSMLIARAM